MKFQKPLIASALSLAWSPFCLIAQVNQVSDHIVEDTTLDQITVTAADLVVEGNADPATAAFEVQGDAVVTNDLMVDATLTVADGLILGPSTDGVQAGLIRWNGTDFEGYDGFAWKSFTFSSIVNDDFLVNDSVSVGSSNVITGSGRLAIGINHTVSGNEASVLGGYNNRVSNEYTTAWGLNNVASSKRSTVWGQGNSASGRQSTAFGLNNVASGVEGTAWGRDNTASSTATTAWGLSNTVSGRGATGWGESNNVRSYLLTAFGRYNVGQYDSANSGHKTWQLGDPLLEIGVGSDNANRANALTILKDGRIAMGVHTVFPTTAQETVQIQGAVLLGDYYDINSVAPTAGALRYDSITKDFLAYNGNEWKSLTQLPGRSNDISGENAIAWGENNDALGKNSTAWGYVNSVDGEEGTAWGYGNLLYYDSVGATAWGALNEVFSGDYSTVWGSENEIGGDYSTVWGLDNHSSVDFGTIWGEHNFSEADHTTVWGYDNGTYSYLSTVFGSGNIGNDSIYGVEFSKTQWASNEPLLEIGNGRSGYTNALTILKDGRVALGTHDSYPRDADETVQVQGPILLGDYADIASASPTAGAIRYDSNTQDFEGYNGSDWKSLTQGGSGGSISELRTPDDSSTALSVQNDGSVTLATVPGDISMGAFTAN